MAEAISNAADPDDPAPRHRPNVGAALFNSAGQVFIGKRIGRIGPKAWQMPQGGVDPGESVEAAAFRELEEETGVAPKHARVLGAIDRWLVYDFPPEVLDRQRRRGRDWIGQKQRWFAFRFTGQNTDIDLERHDSPEFSEWRWERLERTPDLVIPWKRHVYEEVVRAFSRYAERA